MKSFNELNEARGDTAVFTFGRFNPPTTGHEKLINALAKQAGSGSPMYVYPSHSQNPKKDPLPHKKKVAYMRAMFPQYRKNITVSKSRNVFEIAVELYKKGHKAIIMVVGSDRVQEFANLLDKYNGVEGRHGYYGFDNIEVVSAGERDPDAEGVTGMSASKMRAAAAADDFEQFKLGLPAGFKGGEKLFKDVRNFMGIKEEYNLTLEELNRDLYIRGEIWNVGDVVKTTDGDEGTIIRKGTNYVVFEDLRKVWLHNLEEVKQDKDIEDRKGTQPAKYYAKDADGDEMSKSTKQARARHFEKGTKSDDDDPASYKPAPGDANAKTKPSKHTKKFKQMFGERELTPAEKEKMKEYEKKIDMKDFIDRYGEEEGKSVYYATITKMAKGEEVDEKTYLRTHPKLKNLKVPVTRKKGRIIKPGDKPFKNEFEVDESFQLDEKIEGLVKKAEKSGMPYSILKKVYDRGMAAWRTGHRPGTTPQQWGFARVNSFVTKSSGTWGKADSDLAAKVRGSKKKESYEIGTDLYAQYTRKMTPGQNATKESVDEWYNSEDIREKYEERYGDDWFIKLTETYNKMLSKLPCCDDCAEGHLIEENQYRVGSEKYYEFFQEKRQAYRKGQLELSGFDKELMEGDIGKFGWFKGNPVPLDCPMIAEAKYDGKEVELNKPKAGGPKKYYVYVKDPSTGNVKKVTWGDTTGLKVKLDDKEARKSFAARHDCANKKDKTKAGYWACNLPRYAKQLGLSGGGNFFW